MTSTKHPKAKGKSPFADDLQEDPGIGDSKGVFETGEDPDEIEGATTFEGDVLSDSSYGGGVDPAQLGRTNK